MGRTCLIKKIGVVECWRKPYTFILNTALNATARPHHQVHRRRWAESALESPDINTLDRIYSSLDPSHFCTSSSHGGLLIWILILSSSIVDKVSNSRWQIVLLFTFLNSACSLAPGESRHHGYFLLWQIRKTLVSPNFDVKKFTAHTDEPLLTHASRSPGPYTLMTHNF